MDRERHRTFRDTVAEVVLADDLSAAMARLVEAAAADTEARGVVLALEPLEGLDDLVYATGVVVDAAPGADEVLVVDVASRQRRYGRMTALGAVHTDGLESYAQLAATALDTAVALASAQREAERARALLELAAALADCRSVEDLGQALTSAVPAVVGADRALFALDEGQDFRVIAVLGFPRSIVGYVGRIAERNESMRNVAFFDQDNASMELKAFFGAVGSSSAVVIPVLLDNERQGWLYADVTGDPERLAVSAELTARLRGLAAQASTALRNTRLLEHIRHQAFHDALTGLPNRTLILDRAEQLLARARRGGTPVGALFIDLDGFKEINDTLGHAAGDQFLRLVAERLSTTIRESDTLARLGGDEFVVLVEGGKAGEGAEILAARLLDVLAEPFHLDGVEHEPLLVTASIGVAIGAHSSAAELLRDADVALYRAKGRGKNRFVVFSAEAELAVRERTEMETDLCRAVEQNEFFLLYDPVVDTVSQRPIGVRTVLQWQHPERGALAAGSFRETLERTGLALPVGRWALVEACRQVAGWRRRSGADDLVPYVAVELSAQHLFTDEVLTDVVSALDASGLDPEQLVIIVGPARIVEDIDAAAARIRRIATLGVRVTLDPFLARALGIDAVEDPAGVGVSPTGPMTADDMQSLLVSEPTR